MPTAQKSSRKGLWLVVALLVVAVAAVATYAVVQNALGSPSVDDLLARMPADAAAVVMVRGLPQLALDFEVEDTFRQLAEEDEAFRAKLEAMRSDWGFDPGDRESFKDAGVNLLAPMGAAFTRHDGDRWSATYFVPASDEEALDALVRRIAQKEGHTLVSGEGLTGHSEDGTFRYGFRDGYLVAVASMHPETTDLRFGGLLGAGGGAEAPAYQSLAGADWIDAQEAVLDESWKLAVLAKPGDHAENLFEAMPPGTLPPAAAQNVEQWRDVDTLALRIDLTPDRFVADGRVDAVESPRRPLNAMMGEPRDRLAAEIPGRPLAGFRVAVDPQKALQIALEDAPDMEAGLAQVEQLLQGMLGIDLRKDLIPYLGSPVSMALFEDTGAWPMGAAFWMPLKDGHELDADLDRLYTQFSEQGMPLTRDAYGDASWYGVDLGAFQGRWSLTRDHLVIAAGQETAGRVAQGLGEVSRGESLVGSVEESAVRDGWTGERDAYLFADIQGLLAMAADTPGAPQVPAEAGPVLDNLGLLQAYGDYEADRVEGGFSLDAARPNGFREVFREALRQSVLRQ